jgi:hypothetical protein
MTKAKITLRNRKEIIVPNTCVENICNGLKKCEGETSKIEFINFASEIIVCVQDISSIEDIEDDDNN